MEAASSQRCSSPVTGSLSQSTEAKPPTPVTPPTIFATSAGAPSAATKFMHRMPTNEPSNSQAVISTIGEKATSAKRQFVRNMRPKAPLSSAIPVVRYICTIFHQGGRARSLRTRSSQRNSR